MKSDVKGTGLYSVMGDLEFGTGTMNLMKLKRPVTENVTQNMGQLVLSNEPLIP